MKQFEGREEPICVLKSPHLTYYGAVHKGTYITTPGGAFFSLSLFVNSVLQKNSPSTNTIRAVDGGRRMNKLENVNPLGSHLIYGTDT